MNRRSACLLLFGAAGSRLTTPGRAAEVRPPGTVEFDSSNGRLVDGFAWAKRQALAYVFRGDPVGDWYEAALPQRSAFCMRDTSHQCTGAQVLGLAGVTRNMLGKFAANISASRDWCSYWEIDKWDRPAPVDYKSDQDFWYCLPANFDVLSACYRQYLWTGDPAYVEGADFLNFYDRTVVDYVQRWDKDGDGIPESYPTYGRRGIGSYDESPGHRALVGGDLVAAQYAAFAAYSELQLVRGNEAAAGAFKRKAAELRQIYNVDWWDAKNDRFYTALLEDHSFSENDPPAPFALWFGIPENGRKQQAALDRLLRQRAQDVEELSYLPETAYRYGRDDSGYATLIQLTEPKLKRREYPEVSFAAAGAFATGLMGVIPDARRSVIETMPHLTRETEWAVLSRLPVFGNQVTVRHTGRFSTDIKNESGPAFTWHAAFPAAAATLLVHGKAVPAIAREGLNGKPETYVSVDVQPEQTCRVQLRKP